MESERPHLTTSSSGGTSELFICFTSRLSSSSMKISSKSILSPGRCAREPASQISLSSSLSRRLKNSGSLKGGQASPMFPTGGKKRGCAFENPEPSSPKVTCIGQVRVKTKKQGKKMRMTRSKRRSAGEASFRKPEQQAVQEVSNNNNNNYGSREIHHHSSFQLSQQQEGLPQHRNQRWVHLPLTIYEALRAFGAEFNCFLPCRSSCMSGTHHEQKESKEEKGGGGGARSENGGSSSCGAAFARWLVALQDGDGKTGREIELVVGEEEERVVTERRRSSCSSHSQRRQLFEGIEFNEEITKEVADEVEEEARVSICIPPKNALLLMRCRSDPVKMAALANRFWDSPAPKDQGDDDEEDHGERKCEKDGTGGEEGHEEEVKAELVDSELVFNEDEMCEEWVCSEDGDKLQEEKEEEVAEEREENQDRSSQIGGVQDDTEEEEEENGDGKEKGEKRELNVIQSANLSGATDSNDSFLETHVDPEKVEDEENAVKVLQEDEQEIEKFQELDSDDGEKEEEEEVKEKERTATDMPVSSLATVKSEQEPVEDNQGGKTDKAEHELQLTEGSTEEEEIPKTATQREEQEEEESDSGTEPESETRRTHEEKAGPDLKTEMESSGLPDCLLLMMCEPKLSMEVSKETWVCSTDFIRWLPERRVNPKRDQEEPKKQRHSAAVSVPNPGQPAHEPMQPPRFSCSFPATAAPQSMAAMIEQKLVGSKPYEPFVLTRCKSEPMRSAAKLAPDACFWKNRKLEPHGPATLGLGAAGVGF